jgi:hypothetical protein
MAASDYPYPLFIADLPVRCLDACDSSLKESDSIILTNLGASALFLVRIG